MRSGRQTRGHDKFRQISASWFAEITAGKEAGKRLLRGGDAEEVPG
jgi:hypothetical protein